jgi:hypothetical protein
MIDKLFLYISAAQDLERERDLLGRAVVDIPTTLGWRIVQSPIRGEPVDLELITRADLHLVLLGGDIRAPIGLEWLTARRAGRSPALFLKKEIPRTPAAQSFLRYVEGRSHWQLFKDLPDLRDQALKLISNHILGKADYYSLSSAEYERLQDWVGQLEESKAEVEQEPRGVTGESSVIFSPERYMPSEGVLLEEPEEPGEPGEPEGS